MLSASYDLFDELEATPMAAPSLAPLISTSALVPAPGLAARRGGRALHPTVAAAESHPPGGPRSRPELRADLQAANVATVRFDVEEGELVRISQFIPAGNQCIGLYPGALQAAGRELVAALQMEFGVIEWDVATDRPKCLDAPGAEGERMEQDERPRA